MRNGLNIAAVSELVHEIQASPEEAPVRLRTRVAPLSAGLVQVEVATLWGGTIRVARDFRFLAVSGPNGQPSIGNHYDHLLVALGGCVLVTFVQGCSARGITIGSASVSVAATMGADREGRPFLGGVAYEYETDCDGEPAVLLDIAKYVACLSPNHRAFIERASVRVNFGSEFGDPSPDLVVSDVDGADPQLVAWTGVSLRNARVSWVYGTQLRARVNSDCEMLVDQPKQYLGLDSAPNPQEYLLAAAGVQFVYELALEAHRHNIALGEISIQTGGSLDLRGLTNVDPSAIVRVHDIAHTISTEPGLPVHKLAPLARAASGRCLVHAAICREQTIDVALTARGEPIGAFRSDLGMLADYLAELARRREAAVAAAAAASRENPQ
jgi:uncharacterized OsmC-like protein